MRAEPRTVRFAGSLGHQVSGTVEVPEGPVRGGAVFAHCFTCSRRSLAATRISRALADRGFAVLRFDFTGLGSSEGEFADTSFTSNVGDLVAAARWLEEEVTPAGLLVGHSLGGAAVIAAAARMPEVSAVAVIGAPASPDHVAHVISGLTDPDTPGAEDDPVLQVDIGGRPFRLRRSFLDDVREIDQRSRIAELRRPLLVLHSPTDQTVGIDNAREIFETARHPKSFVALDGADHLVSEPEDASYAAGVIAAWASRYVETGTEARSRSTSEPEDSGSEPELADGEVRVTELDVEAFAHRARTADHEWLFDEPAEMGGEDRGPSPYEQLLAALGACTSMTMRMYARRKGWDYGATRVSLSHDRIHARDCESCETESGMLDRIARTIVLDPGLDAEQRQRLLEIADKCPVHRTLTREVHIVTEVPDESGEAR